MSKQYRKRPVVIEAIQFDGHNFLDVYDFTEGKFAGNMSQMHFYIPTLEGNMQVSVGDFVIRGVQGEYYPCKPDIFAQTYEAVGEQRENEGETETVSYAELDALYDVATRLCAQDKITLRTLDAFRAVLREVRTWREGEDETIPSICMGGLVFGSMPGDEDSED